MFQVNLGGVCSTVHTIPPSLHPSTVDHITLSFLFPVLSSACLSLKTKCINLASTDTEVIEKNNIRALPSTRVALQ